MSRFVYEEGEFELADLQCEMCAFWRAQTPRSCEKYSQKPPEILSNQEKCPFFTWDNPILED